MADAMELQKGGGVLHILISSIKLDTGVTVDRLAATSHLTSFHHMRLPLFAIHVPHYSESFQFLFYQLVSRISDKW